MADQPQASIGTVAEEAARLISAMATMARSSADSTDDPGAYAGGPDDAPAPPTGAHPSSPEDCWRPDPSSSDPSAQRDPSAGTDEGHHCIACGRENDVTPVACRLCPLCQGIALLRSVRPETVDRLADLASTVAAALRDVATQSRASGPAPDSRSGSGKAPDGATVQDIRVDDEDEG